MPSKREARNNAIPDPQYAFLGLHQAALSGNVGLVEYALSEGQPVDAVWDGISALHAAAAGGSEHVARLLIENGADVNLGRQPNKEREMRLRAVSSSSSLISSPDSSIPPDRSEALLHPGSTPLHYACAHNNAAVARLLLAAGAAPHVPDKRGVTPLDLLPPTTTVPNSHNLGSSPPADTLRAVIREYYENEKAKEKEFNKSQSSQTLRSQTKSGSLLGIQRPEDVADLALANSSSHLNDMPIPTPLASKRVPVKRSLENLLSMGLTVSPKHISPPSSSNAVSTITSRKSPPPSPAKFTFGTATEIAIPTPLPSRQISPPPPPFAYFERRPSLPHAFTVSPALSSSQPQMPIQQPSHSVSAESSRPRSADGGTTFPLDQDNQGPAVPLPPDSLHTPSPSVRSPPPHLTSFDAPRHPHSHHTHTHSATLPTAALPSPTVTKPPRMKRSLLSLFSKNRDEKEDRERDRSRSKEKDREKEWERSFSRPSFSTLSRPSFSTFNSNGGSAPVPLPSRPSPIPIPVRAHTSVSNSGSSQLVIVPPETVNEVHTAPAERTSFNTVTRSSRLKHADEDEDEEEYGVELRRRGGIYDYIENDAASDEEESEEWEAEEEVASTSEDESEDEHQDENLITNSHEINANGNKSVETSKHVMDNLATGFQVASGGLEDTATPATTAITPLPAAATTSSPTRSSILQGLGNGNHHKTNRIQNSNDTTCGLHRSGSLRFELDNGNFVTQSDATKNVPVKDHKASDRSIRVGSPDRGPKTSLESIVARRSGEGTRPPIIRKKSSLGLKERGSSSILREGTADNMASPVKRTPQSGMMTLPPAVSPSKYRTSSSDSRIATQPTREKSRKSNSFSRRSPRTAIPPLPMPMKVIEATHSSAANASYIASCSSASDDESSPRHRTYSSRSRTPISAGINLRSVSSHAEAEALVKLAAKEIIEMASNPDEFSGDIPQMSLAEQLARYGETLQIERRFARGEAQRWKNVNDESGVDDQTMGPDEENKREAQKVVEEEERRRKVKEQMMWSQRSLDRYAKAENKDKDRERIKDKDKDKDKDKQDVDFGYTLQRTTSHEKDDARISPLPFTKGLSPNGACRPHTSDSVQSNASGSTVTPPRFGHNSAHSSSNIRFIPANQPLRVFQRETPRSGSFDYDRPKFSTTNPASGRRSEDLYRKRYKEIEADEERDQQQQQQEHSHFGLTMSPSQNQLHAPVPGNMTASPSSITPVLPDASIITTNTPTVDDWGSTAGQLTTSGTTRPLKQRFGLKSLFGKNK